jgi:hypothetical protein
VCAFIVVSFFWYSHHYLICVIRLHSCYMHWLSHSHNLFILIMVAEECKLWNFSLCRFLKPVTADLLCTNILSAPCSPNTHSLWRMASSEMLRRVALVITDVSEELSASFIRVTIGELVTTLAVTSNRRTLRRNTNYAFCYLHLFLVPYRYLLHHTRTLQGIRYGSTWNSLNGTAQN